MNYGTTFPLWRAVAGETCRDYTRHAFVEEMRLHVGTSAAEGLSGADLFSAPKAPQNIACTRYVLDAGHSGDFLDLMAGLAPLMLGYGEIGERLAEQADGTRSVDRIATYSGSEYQRTCREVGALIDAAVSRRVRPDPEESPRWPRLCDRFETATRLEVDVWKRGLAG